MYKAIIQIEFFFGSESSDGWSAVGDKCNFACVQFESMTESNGCSRTTVDWRQGFNFLIFLIEYGVAKSFVARSHKSNKPITRYEVIVSIFILLSTK